MFSCLLKYTDTSLVKFATYKTELRKGIVLSFKKKNPGISSWIPLENPLKMYPKGLP